LYHRKEKKALFWRRVDHTPGWGWGLTVGESEKRGRKRAFVSTKNNLNLGDGKENLSYRLTPLAMKKSTASTLRCRGPFVKQ